jgi:uncharacterized BrkB/YihY/UPF0761 family membrane protein
MSDIQTLDSIIYMVIEFITPILIFIIIIFIIIMFGAMIRFIFSKRKNSSN